MRLSLRFSFSFGLASYLVSSLFAAEFWRHLNRKKIFVKNFPTIAFCFFCLLCLAGCAGPQTAAAPEADDRPNVVFFLADDQDIYDYGVYGNEWVHTPAVDRLAREGMRFVNAFTPQAICAPSRSATFTGRYPLKNGCFMNHSRTKDIRSVTDYMSDLGYEVVLAGKSHVQPAKVYDWDLSWETVPVEGKPRKHIPLDSIEAYFARADRPFCMFITSMYPHGKWFDVPARPADSLLWHPHNEHKRSDEVYRKQRSGYYRSIEEDNAQLESVLDLVDRYQSENTLFVYASDHGVTGKFSLYDRGLNVPLVVRWPGVIEAGRVSDVLVNFVDVLPTLVDLAGGEPDPDFDGVSFLPVLKGSEQEIHEYVYGVRTSQNIMAAAVFPSRMVRSKEYKYIRNFNSMEVVEQNMQGKPYLNEFIRMGAQKFAGVPFEELYHVTEDPFEEVNLAKDPAHQELRETLSQEMFAWMKEQEDILREEAGWMPIICAERFQLDKEETFRAVPDHLEGTITSADCLPLEY